MNEFLSGGLAGSISVIFSYPIDTLKTLNQSIKLKPKINNFTDLYKGISYPLYGQLLINGTLFSLEKKLYNKNKNHLLSGLYTGIIVSPLINFFELYKIRHQYKLNLKVNPLLGYKITLFRDSIGTSIYFGTYYKLSKNKYFISSKYSNQISNFLNGGTAGWFSWLFTYWIDTIKTRVQTNQYTNYKEAFKAGNLMSGFKYCSLRCFISNAIIFSIYENYI
jgi:solute carrier family 25 carnitine/acylcarnitine transporter 20/29